MGPALSTVFLGRTLLEKPAEPGLCKKEAGINSRAHRVMEIPVFRKAAQDAALRTIQGDWTKTNCPHTAQQGSALVPKLTKSRPQPQDALLLSFFLVCNPVPHHSGALTPRSIRANRNS